MSRLLLQHTRTESGAFVMLPVPRFTADQGAPGEFGFGGMNLSQVCWPKAVRNTTGAISAKPPKSATADIRPPDEYMWVDDLGEGRYRVRRPFSVRVTRIGIGNFEASFREGNIAISGTDRDDAYQALVAEILDTLDILTEEPNLIPSAVRQLQVLRKYIVQDEA